MNVENKIALVTGGANGIGLACVTELLRNGVGHVAIIDLANSKGEEVVSKLNAEFGPDKAIFVICDVTKPEEFEAGFAKTVKEFGGLDIVVNNAGILDESRWELMIDINFNAVVRGTLLGLQFMGKDKGGNGGTVVNVCSITAVETFPAFPIYSATKHAVLGLSKTIALPYYYEKTGVRILTICPGVTDTQLVNCSGGRTLDIVSPELVASTFGAFPSQKVENVSQGLLHVLRVGENGSVWWVDGGEPIYEIELPDQPVKKISPKDR